MLDLDTVRNALEEKLHDLQHRQERLTRDLAEPLSADFGEQAVEREDDEALADEDRIVTGEIAAVQAAIRRIGEGSYGRCVKCGEPISHARLEVLPEASLCIACAS